MPILAKPGSIRVFQKTKGPVFGEKGPVLGSRHPKPDNPGSIRAPIPLQRRWGISWVA